MSSGPGQVLIIRHGEKLGDKASDLDGGPDLSIRGSARAAALPMLFAPAARPLACALATTSSGFDGAYAAIALPGDSPRFATPNYLFATKASKSSNRPVETITPLASALDLGYDDKHPDSDYGNVATDILTNPKYDGAVVLVCWHHGKIPALATALGIASPPGWPGGVFDRVWVVTFPGGVAALDDQPQSLLFGDSGT